MSAEDLLLEWVSECGSGSWAAFREAHDWLVNAGRLESDRVPAWRTAHTFSILGHMEIDWAEGRWSAAPPVLTMLPSAGAHALLTGGRSRTLLDRLSEETLDEDAMDLFLHEHEQWDAPKAIFIASRDERGIEELASRLDISYTYSVSEGLSRLLPDIGSTLRLARSTPGARGFGVQRFNAQTLGWNETFSDKEPGLYEYKAYGRSEYRFIGSGGEVSAPDRSTGVFAELRREGRSVLRYEPGSPNGVLIVAAAAPLPVLHARTAALCSGLAPVLIRSDSERRYVNVPLPIARRIAAALHQQLRQTTTRRVRRRA